MYNICLISVCILSHFILILYIFLICALWILAFITKSHVQFYLFDLTFLFLCIMCSYFLLIKYLKNNDLFSWISLSFSPCACIKMWLKLICLFCDIYILLIRKSFWHPTSESFSHLNKQETETLLNVSTLPNISYYY